MDEARDAQAVFSATRTEMATVLNSTKWIWFNRLAIVAQVYMVAWSAWRHMLGFSIIWGLMAISNAACWWTKKIKAYDDV